MRKFCIVFICLTVQLSIHAQLSVRIDSMLILQAANQPGFALCIEQDGKLLYHNQVGLANIQLKEKITSSTNFRMASVTKQFTAMGILLLQKDHHLSINDPIGKYLTGLPKGVGSKVLIKHLLTQPLHMNASAIYEPEISIEKRAMGYALDNEGKMIFSDQSITSATKGDGGLYTSIIDYQKWIKALFQNKWLKLDETFTQIHQPILALQKIFYSAGWFYTDTIPQVLFHSGSTCGFNNYVILVPSKKLSIVFFSNMADSKNLFRKVLETFRQCGFADYTNLLMLQDLTR